MLLEALLLSVGSSNTDKISFTSQTTDHSAPSTISSLQGNASKGAAAICNSQDNVLPDLL